MSVYLRSRDEILGSPSPGAVASIGMMPDGERVIVLLGQPVWREIPKMLGVSVEAYVALCVLPHEDVHLALETIGEHAANRAVDKRWPWSWIR